ncbi:unnamed protein product [Prorocentrum cordatum]|uniref:Uncharacterized protein n=1 Tax=Prorocentrum cordatum TaxID=2364126 RepID=A0ABN9TSE1_9DINO|nr:unnamed protein product [Polarella glacialis]
MTEKYLRWALQSRASAAGKPALSVADADMREDVSISTMQEAQAVWLRQERLWSIEKETETLLVFDDGGGTALGPGLRRLLVCGCSESQRRRAAAAAASVGAPNSGGLAAAPAAAQTALGAAAPAAASAASAAETSTTASQRTQPERSNPKEILKTIPWPATVNQWGLLQKKIWIGWPRLPQGWIRCWSRSQDSAYFLRLKDMKTTFEFSEVR